MSNIIKIKRGQEKPIDGTLQEGELGYIQGDKKLCIGNSESETEDFMYSQKELNEGMFDTISVTQSDSIVATDMVSPVEHNVDCYIESKNIANPADAELSPDGKTLDIKLPRFYLFAGDSITLSVSTTMSELYFMDLSATGLIHAFNATQLTFTASHDMQLYGKIYNAAGIPSDLKYQIERGKIRTDYTSYVPDLTSVTVSKFGGNIFGLSDYVFEGTSTAIQCINQKISIKPKVPGSAVVLQTPISDAVMSSKALKTSFPAGTYYVSFKNSGSATIINPYFMINIGGSDVQWNEGIHVAKQSFKIVNLKCSPSYIEAKEIAILESCISFTEGFYSYTPKVDFTPSSSGIITDMKISSPAMTILTDNSGIVITATYNADISKYIEEKGPLSAEEMQKAKKTNLDLISSDNNVEIITNLRDGYSNGQKFIFDTEGNLVVPGRLKGTADKADFATNADGLHYSNYKRITVEGDANTYYPVTIVQWSTSHPFSELSITRGFRWPAPDSWNTADHRGGLTLTLSWANCGIWGGNDTNIRVEEFDEVYTNMVGGLGLGTESLVIWLRGGGAQYQIDSYYGDYIYPVIHYEGFSDHDGRVFPVRTKPDTSNIYKWWNDRGQAGLYDKNSKVITSSTIENQTVANAKHPSVSLTPKILIDAGYLASDYSSRKDLSEFLQGAVKYARKFYPGKTIFGNMTPSGIGYYHIHNYGSANSNGLPDYCSGAYYALDAATYVFGTQNGVWYLHKIITDSTIAKQSVAYAKSAGSVDWANTGHPSTFPPDTHSHPKERHIERIFVGKISTKGTILCKFKPYTAFIIQKKASSSGAAVMYITGIFIGRVGAMGSIGTSIDVVSESDSNWIDGSSQQTLVGVNNDFYRFVLSEEKGNLVMKVFSDWEACQIYGVI